MSNGSPRHYDAAQTLIDTEEGHLMIENFVNIFFVTSLSVSLHNRLDFSLSLYMYIYINAVYQWCEFKSRRGKNKNLTALKSNSKTVWFNFQTYIIFSINLVSLVTLRSSGTDILYGCLLLLDVCIIYFIFCDCIINSSLSYTIY
jgi:hypothetical protein